MPTIKISARVDEAVWKDLKALATESGLSISAALTEAIAQYVARRRVRPEVRSALADSIRDNVELGERLAR